MGYCRRPNVEMCRFCFASEIILTFHAVRCLICWFCLLIDSNDFILFSFLLSFPPNADPQRRSSAHSLFNCLSGSDFCLHWLQLLLFRIFFSFLSLFISGLLVTVLDLFWIIRLPILRSVHKSSALLFDARAVFLLILQRECAKNFF